MKDVIEVIVSIAVAAIPIIGAFVSKKVVNNNKALTIIKAIEPLAQAAVTAAEQLGVTEKLDGAAKKDVAIQSVLNGLDSLGFKKSDEELISNAVEKAYADLKDSIHEAYKTTSTTTTTVPMVEPTTTTSTTTSTQVPVETSTSTTVA